MAKKPIQKKSKKAGKKVGRRKKGVRTYRPYIAKVLKGIKGGCRISKKAMAVFDDMMTDVFKRIASEAKNLCQQTGKKTLSSREIQTAVRLILPGAFPRAYCAHRALRETASSCSGRFD